MVDTITRRLAIIFIGLLIIGFDTGLIIANLISTSEGPDLSPPPVQVACMSGYVNETLWDQAWYGPVPSTNISPPTWRNDSFISTLMIYAHFAQDNRPPYFHIGLHVDYSYPFIWNVIFDAVHVSFYNETRLMTHIHTFNATGEFLAWDYVIVCFFAHGQIMKLENFTTSGILTVSAWWIEVEGEN